VTYSVKSIFYTLQGEGANTGRPAVFCRFAGCNLWSGREEDRANAACQFCDTDFVGTDGEGGGKFSDAVGLVNAIARTWRGATKFPRLVVLTGGEPALQLDTALIAALHDEKFEVAIETNGTLPLPEGIDWICVSPKADAGLAITSGDELKLVFPQSLAMPAQFESLAFTHRFLQPMDGPNQASNTQQAIDYCLAHPAWRLSIQTHKFLGIA
jgi:7-carboxy-7-deazaguanine synthase